MDIRKAFKSEFLKAADLDGGDWDTTIARVKMQDLNGETKPIVYFEGRSAGLVLNRTNMKTIANAYGWETKEWSGNPVTLFATMVEFKGDTVEAIRLRVKRTSVNEPIAVGAEATEEALGDEVPF